MFSFWTFLPLLTFLHQIQPSYQDKFYGPYETILKEIKICEDTGTNQVRIETYNQKKLGKDLYSNIAKVSFDIPVGDNLDVKIVVSKKVDGKWVKGYYKEEFSGVCHFLDKLMPDLMVSFLKRFDITECPFPVGEREMNFTLKMSLAMTVAPYGEYMIDCYFYDGVTVVGCWEVDFEFIPIPDATEKRRKKKNPQKN